MPSSDPIEELAHDMTYPELPEWLEDLDRGPQGAGGRHNFASFAVELTNAKYFYLSDIENLGQEQLMNLCEGMARGTADKLVVAVRSDLAKIRKNVKREAKSISYRKHSSSSRY